MAEAATGKETKDEETMNPLASSTSVLSSSDGVKLLVLGGGYCGLRLVHAAAAAGINGWVSQRHPEPSIALPAGWASIGFDAANGLIPKPEALEGVTHVVSTIAPLSDGQEPVLTHLTALLLQLRPQWLAYLSTTGVYGDRGGAWVDEQSPCTPHLERSRTRLRCEQDWQALGLPVQIFRLPAIYGPGRNPFGDLRAGRSRLLHRPGQVFCRIHVDDICGTLLHCMGSPWRQQHPVVNVSDDEPCPSSEQLGYAAHLLGCKLPDVQRFDSAAAQMSAMARSFWMDNRRVSNALLCQQLGYRLRYPSYREGLRACLAEEDAGQSPAAGAGSAT